MKGQCHQRRVSIMRTRIRWIEQLNRFQWLAFVLTPRSRSPTKSVYRQAPTRSCVHFSAMADRSTYLLDAAARGHYRQVKFFIDARYDLDCTDEEGNTALTLAITLVKDDTARNHLIALLLQGGADPNLCDRNGMTPLMLSIQRKQIDSVRLLLESKRLDFGAEDSGGNSALMYGASLGLHKVVSMILERLSPALRVIYLGQKNREGLTASDLAERANHKALGKLLCWKKTYFFPTGTSSQFANPKELNSSVDILMEEEEEEESANTTTNVDRTDSSYFTCSVTFSSDESLNNGPVVALHPGPQRQFRVQSTDIGIEPVAFTISPPGQSTESRKKALSS